MQVTEKHDDSIVNKSSNAFVNVDKKKVIIALPGENFSSTFLTSILTTMNALIDNDKYKLIIAPGSSSSALFSRMQTLGTRVGVGFGLHRGVEQKAFDGEEFDYWITIDGGQVFSAEQIIDLLESLDTHPVVTGCYRMHSLTHYPIVEEWDNDFFNKNGKFEFMDIAKLETWNKENVDNNYRKVSYADLGFFGMRKEVIDAMKYPFFDGEITTNKGENGELLKDIMSEEVAFCKNIRKAGYDIMLKTSLRVGRETKIVI
jgi:hypothetical protein